MSIPLAIDYTIASLVIVFVLVYFSLGVIHRWVEKRRYVRWVKPQGEAHAILPALRAVPVLDDAIWRARLQVGDLVYYRPDDSKGQVVRITSLGYGTGGNGSVASFFVPNPAGGKLRRCTRVSRLFPPAGEQLDKP